MILVATLFAVGGFLAWLSWTQIARPKVFHLPAYNPPLAAVALAVAVIAALIFCALGPFRRSLMRSVAPVKPPPPWVMGSAGCVWATLWYALVLLAFGIAPQFPPAIAVGASMLVSVAIVLLLPRWAAHPLWGLPHQFATIFGVILGSMLLSFVGFIGGLRTDLYFKIVVDTLALLLLMAFGARLRRT